MTATIRSDATTGDSSVDLDWQPVEELHAKDFATVADSIGIMVTMFTLGYQFIKNRMK